MISFRKGRCSAVEALSNKPLAARWQRIPLIRWASLSGLGRIANSNRFLKRVLIFGPSWPVNFDNTAASTRAMLPRQRAFEFLEVEYVCSRIRPSAYAWLGCLLYLHGNGRGSGKRRGREAHRWPALHTSSRAGRTLSMTRCHAMRRNSSVARGPPIFRGSEIVRNHNGFLAILVPATR